MKNHCHCISDFKSVSELVEYCPQPEHRRSEGDLETIDSKTTRRAATKNFSIRVNKCECCLTQCNFRYALEMQLNFAQYWCSGRFSLSHIRILSVMPIVTVTLLLSHCTHIVTVTS